MLDRLDQARTLPRDLDPHALDSLPRRALLAWRSIGRTFGSWGAPLVSGGLLGGLRVATALGRRLDRWVAPQIGRTPIHAPLVIAGNPRSGTTFLQRFLTDPRDGVAQGVGQELWHMLYPSHSLRRVVRPLLPMMLRVDPSRHHGGAAHEAGLDKVETDDVALLFRHLDGFFLYGFILAFAEDDLLPLFAPEHRDTTARDLDWLEQLWRLRLYESGASRIIAKPFSLSARLPSFQARFQDGLTLYLARDPRSTIPSGMSLITTALEGRFGFSQLPESTRRRYLDRLYAALVELLLRFTSDWTAGRIDRSRVRIIRYTSLISDFKGVMQRVFDLLGQRPTDWQRARITAQAEQQRQRSSRHRYSLEEYFLDEDRILEDTRPFRETFLDA